MKLEEMVLSRFAGAAKARELYPAGHPGRKQSLDHLVAEIAPLHAKFPEVIVGVIDDTLVLNEHPLYQLSASLEDLLQLLTTLEVKSIHLRRSVTAADLDYLFDLLLSKQALQGKAVWIARQVDAKLEGHITVLPEVPDAHRVYNDAISYMGNLFGEIRLGQIPQPHGAYNIARDVSECILRNEQAIVGLTMIKSFDNYLFNHSVNVCVLSMALAKACGLTDPTLTEVGVGGLLHDVGKTRIPKEVLSKPGKLTASEWEIMKSHSSHSYDLIQEMGVTADVTGRAALEHHVQYDHQGYPNLGPGKSAHPMSHLVAIADCYDAITTLRTYQNATAPLEALKIMDRLAGTKLDPGFFERFVAMLGLYPPGSVVRLDSNEIAVVIENRIEAPSEPRVKLIFDAKGRRLPTPINLDLASQDGPPRAIIATIDPSLRNIDVSQYLAAEGES